MMFYYLFNFEGFNDLGGIINHGFNQRPSGIVFNEGFFYQHKTLVSDSSYVFKYISPEAKAISIFLKYLGNNRGGLTSDGKLLIIKINTKNTIETLLLNYDKNDLQKNIKSLLGESNNGSITAEYYNLGNLSSNYWNPQKKEIKGVLNSNIKLPGLSFIYLKMNTGN